MLVNKVLKQALILIVSTAICVGCKKEEAALTPVLSTIEVSDITTIVDNTGATAVSGGIISSDNNFPITKRGVCWAIRNKPTIEDSKTENGTGTGTFSAKLSSLNSNTTYYVRAYATNSEGTAYGNEVSFKTSSLAALTTQNVSNKTNVSISIGGTILDNGGYTVTACGVCWSKSEHPTIDLATKTSDVSTNAQFSSMITGLEPATTYYVRAYASNSQGTAYGNELSVTTMGGVPAESVTDIDGNVYHTITLGTQTWMVENLKTTRYQNGDLIGTTTPYSQDISSQSEPKFQWAFDGNESNVALYGRLYTWYAVADSRNIAPSGWHIPTYNEYEVLETYLINNGYNTPNLSGYADYLGKAMASTTLWQSSSTTGYVGCDQTKNNFSGFNALPAGKRNSTGVFDYLYHSAMFWAADDRDYDNGWGRQILHNYPDCWNAYIPKNFGCSVRCLKNSSSSVKTSVRSSENRVLLHVGQKYK